jgi:hypothetical protein
MGNKKKDKTYYTYGGVETEDTLSFEEREELVEKDTLTDEEREKRSDDDSISTLRSTWGHYHKDRVKYNPNVQYFMLDYFDKNEVRHVRNPYMTQFELLPHIRDYIKNWTDYSEFRIHSEKELDIKLKVECKDGEYRELTLRQILFGNRYEDFSDSCKDPQSDFFKIMYDTRNLSEEDEEEMEQIHETPSSTLSYIKSNDKNSIHPIN